ncbi:hypothetical protein UlMin_003508 [Ulmus minor]
MENSISSMSKALSSNTRNDSPEESSWTMYLEDFLLHNNEEKTINNSLISSSSCESSLISVTGSSAEKKLVRGNYEDNLRFSALGRKCNRLSFKKRKTKEALVDDALEDTASSPLNSPKVHNNLIQLDMKQKEKDDMNMSEERGRRTSGQIDERIDEETGFTGTESDFTELKKKGLCLVPLSMIVNYLG